MMRNRIAWAVIVVITLLLAGCGGHEGSTAAPTSSAAPASSAPSTPTASDEDQIREVLTQEGAALSTWDLEKVGELTCAQFREQAKSTEGAVPPMNMFPLEASASIGPQALADQIGAQFTGASAQSLRAVADAIIGRNDAAYKTAMLDVVKQSSSIKLDKVDNIVVQGNIATSDVTLTQTVGNQPPNTRTEAARLVKEGGQWKDCTPPDQQ
jgi:hypothetical protein